MQPKSHSCNRIGCQKRASTFYMTPAPPPRHAEGDYTPSPFFSKRGSVQRGEHQMYSTQPQYHTIDERDHAGVKVTDEQEAIQVLEGVDPTSYGT